jgi:hypothetical protein
MYYFTKRKNYPRKANVQFRSSPKKTAVAMLHLDVFGADGQLVRANVFMGEGSNGTQFREGFIRHLRLSGVSQMLTVEGAGAIKKVYPLQYIAVRMRLPSGEIDELDGSTMPTVETPVPAVDWEKLKSRLKHLAGLPIQSSGGRVDILLGSYIVHLTTASESRIGQDYEPTASLTRRGWIVRGTIGEKDPSRAIRNHAIFAAGENFDKLAQQLKRFCDTEDFGTEHQQPSVSEMDKLVIHIL